MSAFALQQTLETLRENGKLFDTLNYKKTPEQTDKALADYFAEKEARAKRREEG